MNWIKFLTGGWRLYALIGVVVFATGAASGNFVRGVFADRTIADLKAQVSDAKAATAAETARYNKLWAQTQSAMQLVEADRADANLKAADQSRKDADNVAALQSKLAKTETERAVTSARLTAELNNAKSSDDRPLGPASLRYFDGLRRRQADINGHSPDSPGAGSSNP